MWSTPLLVSTTGVFITVLKDVTAEQRYQLTTPILLVVVRHGCYDRLRVKLERRRTGMNVSLLMFLVVRNVEDVKDQAKIGHGHGKI
ncbi:hypothetical protein DY000_02035873 [Brassica cretica]|uniref:Secreted protein n=1 Tax=Brassica cretica TaxID=69181 RepID=A0ABQ7DWX7_BRACR|nr:hypothetical protein DY000_02035873 [Brassica cretica]